MIPLARKGTGQSVFREVHVRPARKIYFGAVSRGPGAKSSKLLPLTRELIFLASFAESSIAG